MEADAARTVARGYLGEIDPLRASVQHRIAAINLEKNCPRTMAECRTLCESGIVLNYILCPYERLPEFVLLELQAQRRAEDGLIL